MIRAGALKIGVRSPKPSVIVAFAAKKSYYYRCYYQ